MELRLLLQMLLLLLLCISEFRAQEYDSVESRVEGQNLTVECRYDASRYSEVSKVWCQLRDGTCSPLVITTFASPSRDLPRSTSGRATIQDDTRNGIVTVTMKNLQVQDSGVYWCERRGPIDTLYALKTIKLDVLKAVQELSAEEGQTLSLQCPYNSHDDKKDRKAWCRRTAQNTCNVFVSTNYWLFEYRSQYRDRVRNGRAVIHDDTQKGVVTITMEKLQEDDSGVFWCALYVPPDISPIIEVNLTVTKAPTTSDVPVTGNAGPVSTVSAGLTPADSSSLESRSVFLWLGIGLLINKTLLAVVMTLQVRRINPRQRKHPDTNTSSIHDAKGDLVSEN